MVGYERRTWLTHYGYATSEGMRTSDWRFLTRFALLLTPYLWFNEGMSRGQGMRLTYYGYSAFSIEATKTVIVDPGQDLHWRRIGPLLPKPAFDIEQMFDIDIL